MNARARVEAGARTITAVAPALAHLQRDAQRELDLQRIIARGYFTPEEDLAIHGWFARYLTARAGLLETVEELRPTAGSTIGASHRREALEVFLVSYAAAALLVQAARDLITEVATHRLVQRKLNEAEPRFRMPRRQYTAVRRSLTSPVNAWRLWHARRFADAHRDAILALADDPELAPVVACLEEVEPALRVSAHRLLRGRLRYRWHAVRRRRASAAQQTVFLVAEAFGRVVADVRTPWHRDRLDGETRARLSALLAPGDVLITRHDGALSNLLLPGYWPHAALYLGPAVARDGWGVTVDRDRAARWSGAKCVLEARKDGVRFRDLDDTFAVDAVAVIRPRLSPAQVGAALTEAVTHEGKLYNFDFDFFRADRLVCTEVVYRAFDGSGPLRFELTMRSGRPTLSAEDLLQMAVVGRGFDPVALFGCPGCERKVVTGPAVVPLLMRTLVTETPAPDSPS